MHLRHSAGATVMIIGLATAAAAQQQPHKVDVSRLPIDIAFIQRELRQASVREDRLGLNLRYTIDVFGQAPRIVIISPDANLTSGPVPYSAPTHEQMMKHVTPKEFSAPVMDFSALIRWLADRNK